jgi:hypothetical protein
MSEPDVENLQAALARHASGTDEVFPSALALIDAEEHWTGRLWDVTRLVMANQERMRYLAGGDRPDEIAACVARWSESELELADIEMIFAGGGYDPDPFAPLARAGLLYPALHLSDGSPRFIRGERAGAWISDSFALSSPREILEGVERAIKAPLPTS